MNIAHPYQQVVNHVEKPKLNNINSSLSKRGKQIIKHLLFDIYGNVILSSSPLMWFAVSSGTCCFEKLN